MAQQVKFVKVQTYEKYVSAVKTYPNAIVFGEFANAAAIADASAAITSPISLSTSCGFPVGTKLIYANGIQYDVTNITKISGIDSSINYLDSSLATLYEIVNGLNIELGQDYLDLSTNIHDLSTYVHKTVDGSISDISTKVINITNNLFNVSSGLLDVSTTVNNLSTYVYTTVDGSISDISTRLSGALKNASVYAEAGTDSSVKITLVTRTVGDVSTNTEIKVNGSEYVNVQHTNDAVSVSLQNITNSADDINENSSKLVKADDLYDYVSAQINNLEGALIFQGGVANESELNGLADLSTGDVYVATGEFTFNNHTVENGDLLIYGKNDEWVIVERNLDGAVEASTALEADHVVVGGDNQMVKTTDFVLPTVDDSTGIAKAEANQNVLTTEYAVRDYVDNKLAEIKVDISTGTPTYVAVSVDDTTGRDISVGVKTASLGDYADLTFDETKGEWKAADGTVQPDGLATAGDVARTIQDNELVVATALNTFKDKIGLANDLTIDWEGKYDADMTIVKAIKRINVAGDISTAIEGLNSSVVASAGAVLTKVVQEDGKLTSKTEAVLKINNVSFGGTLTEISAEIDANDIKLMTDSEANADGVGTEGNPTVKQAIFGLRDGKIGSVYTGNDEITVPVDSSTIELTSEFTQHTINNEYNLSVNTRKDVSILTELLVTKTTSEEYVATALATDAYVQEQIANAISSALCWEDF